MKRELVSALVTAAGGLVVLAAKQDVPSAATTGAQITNLALEFRRAMSGAGTDGQRIFRKMQKRCADDLRDWAASEGLKIDADLAVAEEQFAAAIPNLTVLRPALVAASFETVGFAEAAGSILFEAVADANPYFRRPDNRFGRDYAQAVIRAALNAVIEERAFFEKLQPHLTLELHRVVGALGAKIDALAPALADTGLSNREVVALLRAFQVSEVPEEERLAVLLEKAHELRDLKTKMSASADAETPFASDLARVAAALDAGDFEAADAILSHILSDNAAQVGQSLSYSVSILAMRGDLAHAQANYRGAAVHYERAAAVASAFDTALSTEFMADQVGSLLEHAARHPGVDVSQEAIRVAEKMVTLSAPGVDRLEAVGSLIAALGQSAERSDALQVLDVATRIEELEREHLVDFDPEAAPEKWLWLASDMGSAFNLAARVPANPRGQEVAQKSVRYLRKAVKLGVKHKLPGVYVAQTNLATALRVFADLGSGRRAHIVEAIAIRRRLLAEADQPDRRSLSNLCDSLGNDYTALADVERYKNVTTLAQAANAYRQALHLRGKSDLPIDRARTQINLSALYGKAAHAAKARDAKRMWRLSRRWSDIALAGLTPQASPADWQRAATAWQWATTTLYELGDRFNPAEASKVARTQSMLVGLLSHVGDFYGLFEALRTAWILCSNIFEADDLPNVQIIDAFRTTLLSELHAYRFTRFEIHLELWEMQAQFAGAALRRDLKTAEAARERMIARLRLLGDNPPSELMVDPPALMAQLDEELMRLRARI